MRRIENLRKIQIRHVPERQGYDEIVVHLCDYKNHKQETNLEIFKHDLLLEHLLQLLLGLLDDWRWRLRSRSFLVPPLLLPGTDPSWDILNLRQFSEKFKVFMFS